MVVLVLVKCGKCRRVLPVRPSPELIELVTDDRMVLLTVQCPKCREITSVTRRNLDLRAA